MFMYNFALVSVYLTMAFMVFETTRQLIKE